MVLPNEFLGTMFETSIYSLMDMEWVFMIIMEVDDFEVKLTIMVLDPDMELPYYGSGLLSTVTRYGNDSRTVR